MLKDKVLVGAIIGITASGVKLTVNLIGYLLGFTNVVFWQLTASRFLDKEDVFTPAAYLIGAVADFTVTAFIGIVFIYAIEYMGKENLWLRGLGAGLTTWVFLFGTLLGQTTIHQEPSGILVTLAAHFVYGIGLFICTGLYFKLLEKAETGTKKIFSYTPQPARKGKVFHIKREKEEKNDKRIKLKKPKKI